MIADATIPENCFVVLDLPERIGEEVLRIKRQFRDPLQTQLPVEITVAGSSGNGVMVPGQSRERVFAILDHIAASTPPIIASFRPVKRFPDTDIFVLTLQDKVPFEKLHRRIDASGIMFQPTPYPFEPHCTLSRRSPISDDVVARLMQVTVPGKIILDTLTVYQADSLPAKLLHRVKMGEADVTT